MSSFLSVLRPVAGPYLYSPSVVGFALIWSAVSHFAGGSTGLTGNVFVRCILATSATALFLVPAMLLDSRIVAKFPIVASLPLRLGLFIVLLGFRGLVFEQILARFQFTDEPNFFFRFIASITGIGVATLAFGYLYSMLKSRRDTIWQVANENRKLEQAISVLNERIATGKDETADRIESILNEEIDRISLNRSQESVSSLQNLLGEVVRPMSHQLASEIYSWAPLDAKPNGSQRTRWYELWRKVMPENIYRPLVITPTMMLVSSPSFFVFDASTVIRIILAVAILMPPSITIIRYWAVRHLKHLTDGKRAAAISAGLVLASVPILVTSMIVLQDTSNMFYVVRAGVFHVPISAWIFALANVAEINYAQLAERFRDSNAKLKWTVARINLITWYQRGETSRVLHGPVQAAIQASLFRIKEFSFDSEKFEQAVRQEVDKLRQVVAELDRQHLFHDGLQSEFGEISAAWEGIAAIDIECSSDVAKLIESDFPCATLVLDVVGEGCVNAIRHGKAKSVRINVSVLQDSVLLKCVDDGKGINHENFEAGLGTRLLEKCSLSWSRTCDSKSTVLMAQLPLAAQNPAISGGISDK